MRFPAHLADHENVFLASKTNRNNPNPRAYKSNYVKTSLGHIFVLEINTAKFSFEQLNEIVAWQEAVINAGGVFNIYNPIPFYGVGGGAPKTRAAIANGSNTIPLDGLPASTNGIYKAGDLIQFTNHPKVYRVAVNLNSNVSGQGTLVLSQNVIMDIPDNESLKHGTAVDFQVQLVSDEITADYSELFSSQVVEAQETG